MLVYNSVYTLLLQLLCMDEDLNNSDLFLTQDFTFEERLDIGKTIWWLEHH